MGSYSSTSCVRIGQSLNLLSSILTISLTCPNSDTLLCYSNDPFLTVYTVNDARSLWRVCSHIICCVLQGYYGRNKLASVAKKHLAMDVAWMVEVFLTLRRKHEWVAICIAIKNGSYSSTMMCHYWDNVIYWAVYWLFYWHVPIVTHCCAIVTTHFQQCVYTKIFNPFTNVDSQGQTSRSLMCLFVLLVYVWYGSFMHSWMHVIMHC